MSDFLSFNSFVTPYVLIFFYYILAIIIPIVLWNMRTYILKKVSTLKELDTNVKGIFNSLSIKNKIIIIAMFLMIFFCMQLCLRMMFEMMIGYFDMHEYLREIAN